MKKIKYLYIDSQANGNICRYDYNLLSNLGLKNIGYITNTKYDAPPLHNIYTLALFNYIGKNIVSKGISYIVSLIKVYWIIRKYRPELVHINWIRMEHLEYLFYYIVKKLYNIRIVYTAHNYLPHDTGEKYKNIYSKFYKMVDLVIVHDQDTKELIINLGVKSDRIVINRHGIISKEEISKSEPFDFRERYNLSNKIIFSLSGTQSSYKGTDIAIKAWVSNSMLSQSNRCCLVIMGKNRGIDYSIVKNTNNILIIDRYFTEEEHASLFEATDVLLLPYRAISQSGVLLTSISYHIPVLVTNIGGLSEALQVANIGWKIEELNAEVLSTAIERIVNDPEQIYKIKNNQEEWNKISKYYSWEEIGKRTKQQYLNVLNNLQK